MQFHRASLRVVASLLTLALLAQPSWAGVTRRVSAGPKAVSPSRLIEPSRPLPLLPRPSLADPSPAAPAVRSEASLNSLTNVIISPSSKEISNVKPPDNQVRLWRRGHDGLLANSIPSEVRYEANAFVAGLMIETINWLPTETLLGKQSLHDAVAAALVEKSAAEKLAHEETDKSAETKQRRFGWSFSVADMAIEISYKVPGSGEVKTGKVSLSHLLDWVGKIYIAVTEVLPQVPDTFIHTARIVKRIAEVSLRDGPELIQWVF